MPVVSYLSVSSRPPMVGVACDPRGFTCRLALKARAFSLSVLDRAKAEGMSGLATVSGAKVRDKLSEVGLAYERGARTKAPVLRDAVATIECALESRKKMGDHLVLFGKVVAANASDAFTDFWDYRSYRPVLYTGWKDRLSLYGEP